MEILVTHYHLRTQSAPKRNIIHTDLLARRFRSGIRSRRVCAPNPSIRGCCLTSRVLSHQALFKGCSNCSPSGLLIVFKPKGLIYMNIMYSGPIVYIWQQRSNINIWNYCESWHNQLQLLRMNLLLAPGSNVVGQNVHNYRIEWKHKRGIWGSVYTWRLSDALSK